MDISTIARTDLSSLPEYIIKNFLPSAQPLLHKYPRLIRAVGALFALWYFAPLARISAIWSRFARYFTSTITVTSEEDLFQYLATWIAEKNTLRGEQTYDAMTNSPAEDRKNWRRRHDPDYEEVTHKPKQKPKIRYEQAHGRQIFIHKKRLFSADRIYGEGQSYSNNRYKQTEVLEITCFGRSPQPIKDLMEEVYLLNKVKERTMTIIRRPYGAGYSGRLSWSRLTAKPRRDLDTVILDPEQKAAVLKDVEEYMDESTRNFYGDHGIPYRRGYLFHGPPGCGKTSFCLALAAKFGLDVYVLTLLDHELQDSDLMSLMNQLPSPSLLLLEDIDTAGLSRKKSPSVAFLGGKEGRKGRNRGPLESGTSSKEVAADLDSDDEETNKPATRISLSGLLNAIDGVAAPEGHILIMTTNKPHDLDDALVRAGRISVKVAFTNASNSQAEQIFLRMYFESPQPNDVPVSDIKLKFESHLQALAKEFAEQIIDGDFSPADLQDYLLIHKKDPEGAIKDLHNWTTQQYEERKRKDEEKEAQIRYKAQKADQRRRQFREDMKAALGPEKKEEANQEGESDETQGQDHKDEKQEIDERPVEVQMKEAEAEIRREERS